jgi:hypothetical protein
MRALLHAITFQAARYKCEVVEGFDQVTPNSYVKLQLYASLARSDILLLVALFYSVLLLSQLGITFASTLAGRLVVALVAPEGEAAAFSSERGGIEAGDVLWSINGIKLDPAALSAEDQLQKLQTMDYPVTLIFKRPNESGVCTPGTVCAVMQIHHSCALQWWIVSRSI